MIIRTRLLCKISNSVIGDLWGFIGVKAKKKQDSSLWKGNLILILWWCLRLCKQRAAKTQQQRYGCLGAVLCQVILCSCVHWLAKQNMNEHAEEKRRERKTHFLLGFSRPRQQLSCPWLSHRCCYSPTWAAGARPKRQNHPQALDAKNLWRKWDWFLYLGCNLRFKRKHSHFHCNS